MGGEFRILMLVKTNEMPWSRQHRLLTTMIFTKRPRRSNFHQSLVQEVEGLFDLSEWSLAPLADIDEPIAVALQRSPF